MASNQRQEGSNGFNARPNQPQFNNRRTQNSNNGSAKGYNPNQQPQQNNIQSYPPSEKFACKNSQCIQNMEQIIEKYAHYEKENKRLMDEKNEYQAQLNEIDNLKRKYDEAVRTIQQDSDQKQRLQEQILDAKANNTKYENEIEYKQQQIEKLMEEKNSLKLQNDKLQRDYQSLQDEYKQVNSMNSKVYSENKRLKGENRKLCDDLEENPRINELQQENQKLRQTINQLNFRNTTNDKQNFIDQQPTRGYATQGHNQRNSQNNSRIFDDNRSQVSQGGNRQTGGGNDQALRHEIDQLKKNLEHVENVCKQLEDQNTGLKYSLQEQRDEYEEQMKRNHETYEGAQMDKNAILNDLRSQEITFSQQKHQLEQQIRNQENEIGQLKSQLKISSSNMKGFSQRERTFQQQLSHVNEDRDKEVSELRRRIQYLERQLTAMEAELGSVNNHKTTLEMELNQARGDRSHKIKDMNEEVKALKQEIDFLKTQLAQKSREAANVGDFQGQVAQLLSDNNQLQHIISDKDRQINLLKEDERTIQVNAQNEVQQQRKMAETQIAIQYDKQLLQVQNELEDKILHMQQDLERSNMDQQRLKVQIRDYQEEREQFQGEINRQKQDLIQSKLELERLGGHQYNASKLKEVEQNLENENYELKSKIKDLEFINTEVRTRFETQAQFYAGKSQELESKCENQQREIQRLKDATHNMDLDKKQQISNLKQENQRQTWAATSNYEHQVEDYKHQLQRIKLDHENEKRVQMDEMETLKQDINVLVMDIQDKDQAISTLKVQLDDERVRSTSQINEFNHGGQDQIIQLQSQVKTLQSQKQNVEMQNSNLKQQYDNLQQQYNLQQSNISQQQSGYGNNTQMIEGLRRDNQQLQQTISQLQSQVSQQKPSINVNNVNHTEVQTLRQRKDELERQILQLETKNSDLARENDSLRRSIQERESVLQKEIAQKDRELGILADQIQKLNQGQEGINIINSQSSQQQATIQKQQAQIAELERAIELVSSESKNLRELQLHNDQLRKQLQQSEEINQRLQSNRNNSNTELERKLQNIMSENERLNKVCKSYESQQQNSDFSQQQELNQAFQMISQRNREFEDLQSQYNSLKSKYEASLGTAQASPSRVVVNNGQASSYASKPITIPVTQQSQPTVINHSEVRPLENGYKQVAAPSSGTRQVQVSQEESRRIMQSQQPVQPY